MSDGDPKSAEAGGGTGAPTHERASLRGEPIPQPFQPFEPGPARSEGERHAPPMQGRQRLRDIPLRAIMPSLITILAICAGLTAVRLAFEGRFGTAVALILAAAFLDGIDGRVARLLKASSRFGEELDSLADAVNFGVVPALVLYAFVLGEIGSLGWIACLVYAVAMTLRLARFNASLDAPDQPAWKGDFFTGVPAPAGAGLVLLPVYLGLWGIARDPLMAYLAAGYAIGVALLLVSALPVYSGKATGGRVPRGWVVPLMLVAVVYVALLVSYEWITLSVTALAYLAFLPLSARLYRQRAQAAAP